MGFSCYIYGANGGLKSPFRPFSIPSRHGLSFAHKKRELLVAIVKKFEKLGMAILWGSYGMGSMGV